MIGIILAGGTSRRLNGLTENTPKCLLDVGGQTMLGRQLEQMQKLGFKKIYIAVGFCKDKIIHYCHTKFAHIKVNFVDITNWYETNNAKGLEQVLKKIQTNFDQDDIFVANADVVCYEGLIKEIINSSQCENLLGYQRKRELPEEDMKVLVDENNNVKAIGKTLDNANAEFTGMAKFSISSVPVLLKYLDMCKPMDWFERAIQIWIQNEELMPLQGVDVTHYPSIEIDFIEDLELANDIFPYDQPVWEQGGYHELLKKNRRNLQDALRCCVDFRDVLNKHGIIYWFNWGLLLGAVKVGHPFQQDTDLDICIHKRDEEKLWEKVVPDMKKLGFFIPERNLFCDNDCFMIRDFERIECNTMEKTIINGKEKYIYSPKRCRLYCPAHHIDTLAKLNMMGEEFTCPSDLDPFLTGWYGAWKLPGNAKPKSF